VGFGSSVSLSKVEVNSITRARCIEELRENGVGD
jgi:hypothetical protein